MRRYFRSDCRFYSYGSVGFGINYISLNTFDRRTFKRLKAPIKHSIVMFITIILILMSHNLAIGVVIDTYLLCHSLYFYKERKTVAMTTYNDYVKWRRTFHQFPEVSQKEYETTKRLKRILKL